jgi:two-component system response regulator FixJ
MSCLGVVGGVESAPGLFGPVYVVDAERGHRDDLAATLRAAGLSVRTFETAETFLSLLSMLEPGCVVAGLGGEKVENAIDSRELLVPRSGFPVVAVTPEADVGAAVRAMKLGAADVVARPVSAEALCVAVRGALAVLARAEASRSDAQATRDRLARLTRRERQVLDGMVGGEANKSIAYRLGISPRTVEVHRAKVMEKLACRSLPEIVRMAMQAELGAS